MRLALLAAAASLVAVPVFAQFTMQTSNTKADLRGIHNVGNGVAWASGTHGTVLRTEDGGYVWQSCSMPPGAEKLDFRGIHGFDANTAIIMSSGPGDQSRLYKTTDGCHTWRLLFTNPDKDGFWDAIQFVSRDRGFLLGDPVRGTFVLFITDDGGRSWIRQENKGLTASADEQGAFAASNSSLLAEGPYVLFASGGKAGAKIYRETETSICLDDCSEADLDLHGRKSKWKVQPIPMGTNTASSGVFSVATLPHTNADRESKMNVAVGGDYMRPNDATSTASFSSDAGEHWQASQTSPHGYRSSVAYDFSTKIWITVGPNGTDISADDGRNWRPVHPDPALHEPEDADRNWNALSLPYVVGPQGRIGRLDPASLKLKTMN